MEHLPPFDLSYRFNANDAFHDKIEWRFCPSFLRLERESAHEDTQIFLHHLSLPSARTREVQDGDWKGAYGWIFGPSSTNRRGYSRKIRKHAVRCGTQLLRPLLFGGGVLLQASSGDKRIEFTLQINPSRLVHHHPKLKLLFDPPWQHVAALSINPSPRDLGGEFALDGKDNWIPQSPQYDRAWSRRHRDAKRCFQLIEEALESEIERVNETGFNLVPLRDGRHSIRTLETYWEFSHPDPTGLVLSLKRHLKALSLRQFKANIYRQRRREDAQREESEKNSVCLLVSLGRGEVLAVYAKTNRRVRFEVRQDFTKNAAHLSGGHTATNPRQLADLLSVARSRCADHLNRIFASLRRVKTFPANSVSATGLLADFAGALHRSENFPTILSLLLANGKIASVPGLQRDIASLRKAGLIELYGPRQTGHYIVTPCYSKALASLARKGAGSLFERRKLVFKKR